LAVVKNRIQYFINKVKGIFTSPTFTFESPFSAPKQACGPEARALRGKSIGGEKFCREILFSFRRMGRAARAPGRAPLHRKTPVLGERTVCPPCTMLGTGPARSKKRGAPHDFSAQCPCFRAGHGLKFNRLYNYLAKSEGGQGFSLAASGASPILNIHPPLRGSWCWGGS